MSQITDSYTMNIQVISHGIASIQLPITFPASVEKNAPFTISYTVKNSGTVSDTLFGSLKVAGVELTNSAWTATVTAGGSITKTYNHAGIATNTTFLIETGHQ
jgi:hypothetical protein